MTRQQQLAVLAILAAATALLLWALITFAPTVNGVAMREAELRYAMDSLQPTERFAFFCWLAIDSCFAVSYTALFARGLRWLAADAHPAWFATLGRGLSHVVILAILFDLAENLILCVSALINARGISPWLPALVKLKWLSAGLSGSYLLLWIVLRYVPRRGEATSSGSADGPARP